MTAAADLAADLLRIGRSAGLDAVGICHAGPFDDVRQNLHERHRLGYSAGMQFTYRNPERSTDPSLTLPGARAILVGARTYLRSPGPGQGPDDQVHGAVARYSWVDHYRPLRGALAQVAERLIQEGWKAVVLADDNALVDRAAAVRAGLGWYGKNTNVLLPDAGSWFVIGSVVTDAPIDVAAPPAVEDGCGSCHRCMDDCPTGAIVAPGQLDARRCLAWLLQAPGVFPVEYRQALGDRIYGCDDCQTGCPVNRISQRRSPPPVAESGSQMTVDVLGLLGGEDAEVEMLIGRWYIPGRQLRYVRRNALIVLGNVGDGRHPAVQAALARALADSDPVVRSHAVWAAHRLGCGHLAAALADDPDPMVRQEMNLIDGGGR